MMSLKLIFLVLSSVILINSEVLQKPIQNRINVKEFQLKKKLEQLPLTVEDHKQIGKFTAEEEINSYRLPNDSIPLRYDIFLSTDIDKAEFQFSGRVKIHIQILEPTQLITLHYRQISVSQINFFNVDGTLRQSNLEFDYISTYEFLKISLPLIMNQNDELVLEIFYSGTLRQDNLGLYRSSYLNEETNDRVWLATTQFSMTEAVKLKFLKFVTNILFF